MWMRLRSPFRRNFVEAELDEELQFHFEKQVQKLVAEGFRLAEAQRRARLAIGGTAADLYAAWRAARDGSDENYEFFYGL